MGNIYIQQPCSHSSYNQATNKQTKRKSNKESNKQTLCEVLFFIEIYGLTERAEAPLIMWGSCASPIGVGDDEGAPVSQFGLAVRR